MQKLVAHAPQCGEQNFLLRFLHILEWDDGEKHYSARVYDVTNAVAVGVVNRMLDSRAIAQVSDLATVREILAAVDHYLLTANDADDRGDATAAHARVVAEKRDGIRVRNLPC